MVLQSDYWSSSRIGENEILHVPSYCVVSYRIVSYVHVSNCHALRRNWKREEEREIKFRREQEWGTELHRDVDITIGNEREREKERKLEKEISDLPRDGSIAIAASRYEFCNVCDGSARYQPVDSFSALLVSSRDRPD